MAREAYRSLYGDLTKLKDNSLLDDPAGGTGDDDELFQLLMAVSEMVDSYCNRRFYPRIETLIIDGQGGKVLLMPDDLISVTTLKQDDSDDTTYNVTWAATDYRLLPAQAAPTQHWGSPYTSLQQLTSGAEDVFTKGTANFEVAGKWGWREFTEDSGSLLNGSATASATTVTVDDGTDFIVGQTVIIDTEQMLVTGISSNVLTVTRALNGTTGATHADNATVKILRWPGPVERATLIQAARIWTRAPSFEPFYVDADLDTDVRMMLDPYRKPLVTG